MEIALSRLTSDRLVTTAIETAISAKYVPPHVNNEESVFSAAVARITIHPSTTGRRTTLKTRTIQLRPLLSVTPFSASLFFIGSYLWSDLQLSVSGGLFAGE